METSAAELARRAQHATPETGQGEWFRCASGTDGTAYLTWPGMLDAAVDAQGARVELVSRADGGRAAFQNYLLAQVLSFPLIRRGLEPLHATTVATPFGALGLLGDSGAGKSTLAAGLVGEGARLSADDLLALRIKDDVIQVFSGPPVLKLTPHTAAHVLASELPSQPMHRFTRKRAYTLPGHWHASEPAELRALFVLEPAPPPAGQALSLAPLTGKEAVRRLLHHTFNPLLTTPQRLQRQLELYGRIAAQVPIVALRVRRDKKLLPVVARALLEQLTRLQQPLRDQAERADHVIERKERIG
ncbi:MAG: hypothetical protein ACRENP_18905 [Longimicrobiales bacterium]